MLWFGLLSGFVLCILLACIFYRRQGDPSTLCCGSVEERCYKVKDMYCALGRALTRGGEPMLCCCQAKFP